MSFEEKIDELFLNAIGVHDTVWFSSTETLRDAIVTAVISECMRCKFLCLHEKKKKLIQYSNCRLKRERGKII